MTRFVAQVRDGLFTPLSYFTPLLRCVMVEGGSKEKLPGSPFHVHVTEGRCHFSASTVDSDINAKVS